MWLLHYSLILKQPKIYNKLLVTHPRSTKSPLPPPEQNPAWVTVQTRNRPPPPHTLFKLDSMSQSTGTYGFEDVASAAALVSKWLMRVAVSWATKTVVMATTCKPMRWGDFHSDARRLPWLFLSSCGDEPRRGRSPLWSMALVSVRAVIVGIGFRAVITARRALGRRIGITFIMLLLQCFLDNTTTRMYLQKREEKKKTWSSWKCTHWSWRAGNQYYYPNTVSPLVT